MTALAVAAPDFAAEVFRALSQVATADVSKQISAAKIERVTFDPEANAGYIYLVRGVASLHFQKLATPVAETHAFLESGFNVDIDHDGQLFGIEVLGRADIISALGGGDA